MDRLIKKSSLASLIAMANALMALLSDKTLIEHFKHMPLLANCIHFN